MANIYLCVDRDGWTGGYQLSIDDDNGGFRIAGPKYNGSSKRLIHHRITERDVHRIREYLDKVKPAVAETHPRDSSESTPRDGFADPTNPASLQGGGE